jgi:hypothetical protein
VMFRLAGLGCRQLLLILLDVSCLLLWWSGPVGRLVTLMFCCRRLFPQLLLLCFGKPVHSWEPFLGLWLW